MKVPRTKQEAIDSLRSGCEQSHSRLNELIGIHFQLDPADRPIDPADDDIVYHMRKVLLHVKSVSEWDVDTEVLHVLAPELRTAGEQIDKIWKNTQTTHLENCVPEVYIQAMRAGRSSLLRSGEILSSYVHPSPQRLLLGGEHGGLAPVDEVRYFACLLACLTDIVVRYAVCLKLLSETLDRPTTELIDSILYNSISDFNKISPTDHLRFAAQRGGATLGGADLPVKSRP